MTKRIGPKEAARRQLRERPRSKRKEVVSRPRAVSSDDNATPPATVAAPGAVSRHNHSAETLAPPGECAYCDRRRARSAASMRETRKKAKKEATA